MRALLLFAALFVLVSLPGVAVEVQASSTVDETSQFKEVGQIPIPTTLGEAFKPEMSGWLVMDAPNRRGYTLTESFGQIAIESFDLDTLQIRQRVVIPGMPIPSGFGQDTGGGAVFSGDIVHAVDSVAKRVYIPIASTGLGTGTGPEPDNQRAVSHVLILDEEKFDRDPQTAFGSFDYPVAQQRLKAYPLQGLAISHHHVAAGKPGKLLAVFSSPYQIGTVPVLFSPTPGPFDHTLVQWSPGELPTGRPAPSPPASGSLPLPTADWEQLLYACATAPLSSQESKDAIAVGAKNYQWAILSQVDAVHLPCQSAPQSGAVVRLALDPDSGSPALGANQQIFSIGRPLADGLADAKGNRLYLKSFGGGATWWAFDTGLLQYVGAIAGHLTDGQSMSAGIDPASGRLYTLTADTCVERLGGVGDLSIRGGIKVTEARLASVPAPEIVRPDMAYNSWWKIHVDEVTRRVYVRRGIVFEPSRLVYPECDLGKRVPAPLEPYYRVFEDRIPVAEKPAELDDSQFTTNVAEEEGLTQASFVGSGAGYGARAVLTGGLAAATNGGSDLGDHTKSPCSREDRELLAGSVGKVEVSDQSTVAEAASLDADAQTQVAMGDPLTRCRRDAPEPQGEDFNSKCWGDTPASDELAFDEKVPRVGDDPKEWDANEDGCVDRTGVNKYSASCTDDGLETTGAPARTVPRDGFKATAKCEAAKFSARSLAVGSITSATADKYREEHAAAGPPGDPLTIGHSSSEVKVSRELGKGVTVTVDSIARAVEIPGVGRIGVVRAEAQSTATGRDGRASGSYKRTICDVRLADVVVPGCLDEALQDEVVKQVNDALGGRVELRLRRPDAALLKGTDHGYLSAVQRDRLELFEDQSITRDRSLTIPALEVVAYQGDGGAWGAGRQVIQLAGVQAATSYGIVCSYGQLGSGKCSDGTGGEFGEGGVTESGEPVIITNTVEAPRTIDGAGGNGRDNPVVRLLKRIPQAIAEALRLLFNNPRELGLMAAVWGLLYAPCYVGERRRSLRDLGLRRVAGGAR